MLSKRHKKQAHSDPEEIWNAMGADEAKDAAEEFMGRYGRKHPDIAESLRKDLPLLLTFFDLPAEHRKSIRSANTIESMFSGVKHRQGKREDVSRRRLRPAWPARSAATPRGAGDA